MKTCMCKVQYLLFALLMFTLAACSGSSSSTMSSAPGAVAAKLVFNDGKTTGKTLAALPTVTSVRLMVTGATIPTAKQDFPGITGGTLPVYPGSDLIVTAFALDNTGAVVFEGYKTGIAVTSGATTDVGQITMNQPVVKAENSNCLTCHETSKDITGQNLIANYKQSGHYTNTSWLANAKNGSTLPGCAGCHGTQHQDSTPSESGRCFECHGTNLSLRHTNTSALTAGDANPARFLNLNGTNCSACHEPHNPLSGTGNVERKDWEKSGHGDINGAAWIHYDFTTRDTCNSCHTAAGFVNAVGNNFTNKKALSLTTLGKQPLTCDACHSSNDFKNSVRALSSGYVPPYPVSANATPVFPDGGWLGNSQLCLPCHASMNGSKTIETANPVTTSTSHYMAAAATMFMKNGFTAFTSASAPVKISGNSASTSASTGIPLFTSTGVFTKYTSIPVGYVYTYGNSLTSASDGPNGAVTSTHRLLGTAANPRSSGLIKGGPCVTCHMGYATANHTWGMGDEAFNTVCVKCHSAEGGVTLTAANYKTLFIEEQAVPFNNALKVGFNNLSTNYHIAYNGAAYPYLFKAGTRATLTASDWTLGGVLTLAQSRKLAGAAFNLQMLSREPAAYVHARTYTRRLLYDTIDYLDDGAMNMSVTATAIRLYPADYGASVPANASTATSSLAYLKAYNRTGNAWYSSERP